MNSAPQFPPCSKAPVQGHASIDSYLACPECGPKVRNALRLPVPPVALTARSQDDFVSGVIKSEGPVDEETFLLAFEMANSGIFSDRLKLLRRPDVPERVLIDVILSDAPSDDERAAALSHPNLPEDFVQALWESDEISAKDREHLSSHPHLRSLDTHLSLLNEDSLPSTLLSIARADSVSEADLDEVLRIAQRKRAELQSVLSEVLQNGSVSLEYRTSAIKAHLDVARDALAQVSDRLRGGYVEQVDPFDSANRLPDEPILWDALFTELVNTNLDVTFIVPENGDLLPKTQIAIHDFLSQQNSSGLAFWTSRGLRVDRGGWWRFLQRNPYVAEEMRKQLAHDASASIMVACNKYTPVEFIEDLLVRQIDPHTEKAWKDALSTNQDYTTSPVRVSDLIRRSDLSDEAVEALWTYGRAEYARAEICHRDTLPPSVHKKAQASASRGVLNAYLARHGEAVSPEVRGQMLRRLYERDQSAGEEMWERLVLAPAGIAKNNSRAVEFIKETYPETYFELEPSSEEVLLALTLFPNPTA